MKLAELFDNTKSWLAEKLRLSDGDTTQQVEELEGKVVLPTSYLDLFALKPLAGHDKEVRREKELELLKTAYDNWKISQYPILLVAEAGMGLTSFLQYAQDEMLPDAIILQDDINVGSHNELVKLLQVAFDLPNAKTLKDLSEQMSETPQVVIFENIERLFLRRVHGFNLIQDFLLFIHATKKSVFWISTINKYSYYYLQKSINIGDNFMSVIHLQPFGFEKIREVINKRNEGYEIIFLKPNRMSTMFTRKLDAANSDAKQGILEDHFYRRLHDFSGGNISRSMYFWLNSIKRFRENKIYVKLFEPKPITNLSLNELFILEAILQHTSLSYKELELVLRQEQKSSRLVLEFLSEKGFLSPRHYQGSQKPEFQIHVAYLKELQALFHSRLNRNV